jgi:hypothetical protein
MYKEPEGDDRDIYYITPKDLVYYRDPDTNKIMSCGFEVSSVLLNHGLPLHNSLHHLAVPAGLLSSSSKKKDMSKNDNNPYMSLDEFDGEAVNSTNTLLEEDIYNHLLKQMEFQQKKERKTRKRVHPILLEGGRKSKNTRRVIR